jgi:ribulose kinase
MFLLILVGFFTKLNKNIQKTHQNQQKHTKDPPKSTKTYKKHTKVNKNIQKTHENQQKNKKDTQKSTKTYKKHNKNIS